MVIGTISRQIIWIILTLLCSKITIQAGTHQSYVYTYCTNVTTETENKALRNLCGQVVITPYNVQQKEMPWTILNTGQKIVHLEAVLESDHKGHGLKLEAVALFNSHNAVELLYVPESAKVKASELNHIKGILSLLVVNPALQHGLEVDSFGQCQVTYATVDDVSNDNGQYETIDKEKTNCHGFQKPLDTWSHNSIPIASESHVTRKMVRYRFDKLHGMLLQAIAFEQQEIRMFAGLNLNEIKLTSWQNLEFQKTIEAKSSSSDGPDKFTIPEVTRIAEQLTGTVNRVMHLAAIYPLEHADWACSLNSHLYHPLSNDFSAAYYEEEDRLFSVLRNLIEKARDSLHVEQFGQVNSLHTILQLVRLLRCLPDRSNTIDLLNEASKMAPTAVDASVLYRQHDTWREQLVDVLVVCGTPTCVAVLVQRLEALTELAQLKHIKQDGLSSDVIQVRKMLFMKLWPALAHLKRTDNELLERLFGFCDQVIEKPMRTLCLMTIVNLRHTTSNISITLENQIVENINKYLLVQQNSSNPIHTLNENKRETRKEFNSRLLIGLSLSKQLASSRLFQSVLDVAQDKSYVPPTVRAFAIQTLPNLVLPSHPALETDENYSQVNQVRQLLGKLLIQAVDETENDLVIGRALFDAILALYPSAVELIKLIEQLAHQNRWPLVRTCRLLIDQACNMDRLSIPDCICFKEHCQGSTQFGFAGGWSGLAAGTSLEMGEVTLLQGDLFNVNQSLIADYSLQVVSGADGEFRQSGLVVNLFTEHGETRLFEFNVHTEGMDTLTSSTRSKSKTKSKSKKAWASVELNYLDTRLPPWTVFAGGLQDMLQLLLYAPSEPTPVLQVMENAVDQRLFSVFGTGWVIRVDTLGLFAVQVSGAMETSIWSQSGYSLVRVQLGVVCEVRVNVVHEQGKLKTSTALLEVQGFGGQGTLDFITHVKVMSLPEGICMSMNRKSGTTLHRWNALHPITDAWLQGRSNSDYRELENPTDYRVDLLISPGTSYDLGRNNTRRCNMLGSKTLW